MSDEKYVKYPRTPHLPWSSGTKDDRILRNDSHLVGKEVVVTLKMDGENTTMYNDKIHARSLDSESHPSQSWVKQFHAKIASNLTEDDRICGENMFAKHTVAYDNLESYFYGFSWWSGETCHAWDVTTCLFELLDIPHPTVIYDGIYDAEKIKKAFEQYPTHEGYVLRLKSSFTREMFGDSVGKYVKPEFKQAVNDSNKHWKQGKFDKNQLKQKVEDTPTTQSAEDEAGPFK
jgi:hypothetical protein